MLHGVWSNEADLFGLSEHFSENDYVFSLQWPFHLGWARYAWYRVDFSTGKPLYEFDEIMIAYSYITDFIKNISEKYSLKPENIFLMGFSQGAIMSYYTLARNPELIWGIIALSGRLLKELDSISIEMESYNWKKVFIWHGTEDTMMTVEQAEQAAEYIKKLGIEPTCKFYIAPHTITGEEIQDIVAWL